FVLVACFVFMPAGWAWMLIGFLAPNAVALGWLWSAGALPDYVAQVWRWGLLYASVPPGDSPLESSLVALRNWAAFHAALLIGAVSYWMPRENGRVRMALWLGISLVAAGLGLRSAPRYLNQLLPPLVIIAARGVDLIFEKWNRLAITALAIAV